MKTTVIYEKDDHKWLCLGRDPELNEQVIDTNEFVIVHKGQSILLDPGGSEIFPRVLGELSKHVRIDSIRVIFASHQDPDIASSLPLWLDLCPDVKVYCSWLWGGFISHFLLGTQCQLDTMPDEGITIPIGDSGASVEAVPAHYCHSPGNFGVWDEKARILFSGDIGAALLPPDHDSMYVEDFSKHVQYMKGFHQRWMPSTRALRDWVARVRKLQPDMICPQHGAIFRGKPVNEFLDWLEQLEVGIA